LELVGFGILIVDVNGQVLMANRAANAIIRKGDGLRCRRGQLVCEQPREASALHEAIRAAAQPLRAACWVAGDLCVSRGEAQRPFTVHVVPIPSVSAWNGFAPPSGVAAVFVIDPQVGTDDIEGLATAYSLTNAERRVLHEIVHCTGLVEAAAKLRIAVPTARTHLQNIFAKTNTSSQTELVRLVLTSTLGPVTASPVQKRYEP
jgi:DNA-binding CsgD family transcriptional regulator